MKKIEQLIMMLFLFVSVLPGQQQKDPNLGAVIVAATEGSVSLLNGADDNSGSAVKAGEVIPLGKFIVTGPRSKLTLLLSNGTLVSLEESTRMKVGNFQQTPFDGQGKKVSELAGEPSNSKVDLDLDVGSLVLKTKKLNKGSSFNIRSKGGTAGIRGTEFQLAFDPGAGIKLDVTESTVDFTPPGGQPMPVTQGQGLDVSVTGQVAPRPVSPAAAQNISNTNQAATEVSADISMDTVSEAITESTELSTESEGKDDGEVQDDTKEEPMEDSEESTDDPSNESDEPAEEGSTEPEDSPSETEDTATEPEEPTTETDEPATEPEEPSAEPQDDPLASETTDDLETPQGEETSSTANDPATDPEVSSQETVSVDSVAEDKQPINETPSDTPVAEVEIKETMPSVDAPPEPASAPEVVSAPTAMVEEVIPQAPKLEVDIKIEEIIERNPDAKQVQETGKAGAPASELAKLPLDEKMLDQYRDLPEGVQKELIKVGAELVETIFSVDEIDPEAAVEFLNLSPNAQEMALELEEETLVKLLAYDLKVQESLVEVDAPVVERLVSLEKMDPEITSKFVELSPDARDSALRLEDKTMVDLLEFEPSLQEGMLDLDTPVVERMMSIEEFTPKTAAKFVDFTPEAQNLTLGLEDIALVTLLDQDIDEELILSALTPESIQKSSSENIPTENKTSSMSEEVLNLGDNLRESGNADLYDEIVDMADGEIDEDWVKVAEVAESLTGDVVMEDGALPVNNGISGSDALGNPFFQEISSLYDVLEDDTFIAGDNPSVIGGDIISMQSGIYDVAATIGDASSLVLGASETFDISGDIEFVSGIQSNPSVIIMSGDDFSPAAGGSITSKLDDLVIASRGNVLLNDSRLESVSEIAIRALADIDLQNVGIQADYRARIRAAQDLDVNGLEISQSLPSLIMEATTIRLRNVDFPSSTQVQLNSLKGPIDGRYPNFGTAIPLSEQVGRVNFLENIKSGGNLIMDRSAFDQLGGNITIGKLP